MSDGAQPTPEHHEALPEGEEQAPPGTRTMAIVRWSLVALMALAAVAAWTYHVRSSLPGARVAGQQFICPMHPQIVTERKGECPICGMDLVPPSGASGAAAPQDPAAAAPGAAPAAAQGAPQYTCPMHPAFVTADPRARCPDCGMKLAAVVPPAPPPPPGATGVPGLAAVELTADRVQLIGMRTAPALRQPLSGSFKAVGFVAPNEAGLVSVTTRFSGWVEGLSVGQTGQLVKKGDVLASVYSPEMLNAQQVFLNAIKWSDRKLGAQQPTSPGNDLERDARVRLELLGVAGDDIDAIAKAGTPLRAVNVRSPARGYVARKNVLRGLYVQAGSELFQIADLSTVWVLIDVYESEISRVAVGQQAVLQLSAYPGERFRGTVQFVYPALNTGSRTLQARLEFRNPGLKLRPGMYGDVTLETGGGDALVVPVDALIDTGEHQYVFVERGGGRFEPRAVRAAPASDGKVAILSGLAEGERVVTTANFLLDSESRLRAAVEGFAATASATSAPTPASTPTPTSATPPHAGHSHPAAAPAPMPMPGAAPRLDAPMRHEMPMPMPPPGETAGHAMPMPGAAPKAEGPMGHAMPAPGAAPKPDAPMGHGMPMPVAAPHDHGAMPHDHAAGAPAPSGSAGQ